MVLVNDISPIIINLPIIVTIVAATRYIIGFKTWRNYSTIAIALAFFFIHETTHMFLLTFMTWSIFLIAIIGGATASRYLIRRFKVNYYSRMSLVYLGGTLGLFLALFILQFVSGLQVLTSSNVLIGAFLMGLSIDDLATLQFKKDMQEFFRRIITIVVLGFLCGMLLTWGWWNKLIAGHQEILLIVIVIDFILAFWTNIRVTELLRFKSISRS